MNSKPFTTQAQIQDAAITGAHNVTLLATSNYVTTAEALAGVNNQQSLGASIAAMIVNNVTTANTLAGTTVPSITGSLTVSAMQTSMASNTADAERDLTRCRPRRSARAECDPGRRLGEHRPEHERRRGVSVAATTSSDLNGAALASQSGADSGLPLAILLDTALRATIGIVGGMLGIRLRPSRSIRSQTSTARATPCTSSATGSSPAMPSSTTRTTTITPFSARSRSATAASSSSAS